MGSVGTPVVRRMIEVAGAEFDKEVLLTRVGLGANPADAGWSGESVDEVTYYELIEHIVGGDDHGFPFRYAHAMHPDDLGALGLAVKTAATVGDALERLLRYVLVLSDTLEYEFLDTAGGRIFALTGRPHHRRGAALANECALGAVVSILRHVAPTGLRDALAPRAVTFRHGAPPDDRPHRAFFGCPVHFDAELDGLDLADAALARPTMLADEGLSSYLLQHLDELRARASERSIVDDVRAAVADMLPDGQPGKSQIARRLALSERTLHRRLADEGETFQSIATTVRREAAESLLARADHSLAEVAFLTGFSDQTAFTRAFKRWTGQTPAGYRSTGR